MTMPRSRWFALAPLCVLLCLSLACVGGGEPSVQQEIHYVRTDYDTWLRSIGAAGSLGRLGQPWIVAPEHDSEVSGEFEVKGWAARPSDVVGVSEDAEASISLYVLPETLYATVPSSYWQYSVGLPALVNPDTGEWSMTLNSSHMMSGSCAIVAVEHMSDDDAFLTSDPMAIAVTYPDGTRTQTGQAWPAATDTIHLACVMARPKGESFPAGAEAKLRGYAADVQSYFRDTSRGHVQVVLDEWVVMDGELSMTNDELQDEVMTSRSSEGAVATRWINETTAALSIPETLGPNEFYVVVVFQPPDARSWRTGLFPEGDSRRGGIINLYMGDDSPVGVIAHEISHALGDRARGIAGRTALPDLYNESGIRPDNYNNFFWSADRGEYFLMADSRPAKALSGYSQEWLGWLDYIDEDPGTAFDVPYIDGLNADVDGVHRVLTSSENGRNEYIVFDARSNRHSPWELYLPKTGVVVYRIQESTAEEQAEWSKGLDFDWPRSINWLDLLEYDGEVYHDFSDGLVLKVQDLYSGGSARVEIIEMLGVLEDAAGNLVATGSGLAGAVMDVDIGLAPVLASYEDVLPADTADLDSPPIPDLDLHAYLADGTHIGVNYETGQFENPVDSALVSGDLAMDAEWIMLPPDLAATARFEVSSSDVQAFQEAEPELAEEVGPIELSYSVQPTVYDEAANTIAKGEPVSGTLAGDESSDALELDIDLDDGAPPAFGGGGGPAAPPSWRLPAVLGGSALLVLIGLVVLLKPLRRK